MLFRVVLAGFILAAPALAQPSEQDKIDFANGLFKRAMYDMAADGYREYVELFPEGEHRMTAMYRLGESLFFNGDLKDALDAFDAVLVASPEAAIRDGASLRKGEILLELDQNTMAAEVLAEVAANAEDKATQAEARYFLGKAHYQAGNFPKALETFQAIVDADPEGSQASYARYQTALVYLALNEPENAATAFTAVAKSNAPDALRQESMFRAAEAYDALGWHESSQAAYQLLKETFPGSDYARKADYGHAWALYHAGRYADALKATDAFLASNAEGPAGAGMLYLRANCLNQQRQYDAAMAAYAEINEQFPDSDFAERSQYKVAWIHQINGRRDEAKALVSELLKTAELPSVIGNAGFLLGTIFMEERNFEDAEQEFNLLWEKYRDSEFAPESLYKRAECLAMLNRADDAAKAFKLFATTFPHNPLAGDAALRSGDAKVQMAAFEDAVAEYRALLDTKPDPDTELETRYRLAVTYHNMQNYEASANEFKQLAETFPESKYAAEAQVRIGDYHLRDGNDPTQAIDIYETVIKAEPEGAFAGRAMKGIALARHAIKDFDAAADTFLNVMTTYPEEPLNEATYDWVAAYLFSKERWEDAATVYRAMLKSLPDYPKPEVVQLHIGECLERADKLDEAIAEFEKVIEMAPHSGAAIEATYRLAQIAEKKENLEEAMKLYEAAASGNTTETGANARMRLGELLEEQEDFDAARKHYMMIVVLVLHEELSPEALFRAGRCSEKMGNPDGAVERYRELIKDFPDSEQANKARERLTELAPQ